MNRKLILTGSLVAFFASASFAFANLTQIELQPQSSFTCNATGTIYYSLSNNQLMLCTSGSGSSPVLTSSGSGGTNASFSSLTVSGITTLATASGNVGIGTTAPNAKLDVEGGNMLALNGGGTTQLTLGNYAALGSGGSNAYLLLHAATTIGSKIILEGETGGQNIVLDNTGTQFGITGGNVGINTTSPGTNLDVNGNINVGSVLYDRSNTNYYVNPSGNIMPYAANLGGSINVAGGGNFSSNVNITSGGDINNTWTANGEGSWRLILGATSTGYGAGAGGFGIYNNTDALYHIVFHNNGSTSLGGTYYMPGSGVWNSAGNVGIGTTNPGVYYGQQAILDVNGYAAIGGLRIKGSDTVNTIYQTSNIGIKTAGGGIQILNSNGYVGIGTTAPSTNLDVVGGTFFDTSGGVALTRAVTIKNSGQAQLSYGAYPWEWSPSLQLQSVNNNRFLWMNAGADNGSYNARIAVGGNGLDFYTNATTTANGTLALSMNTNGRVGVGTSAPSTAGLVVATNVSGAAIDVQNNRIINVGTPINAADAATKSYVDSSIAGGSGSSVGYWTLSGSNLYPSGSYNVGIGYSSPSQKLTVAENSGIAFTLGGLPNPLVSIGTYGANPTNGLGFFVHDTTSGYDGWVGAIRPGGENCGGWGCKTLRFEVPNGSGSVIDAMSIAGTTGYVGVGPNTTSPGYPLVVGGAGDSGNSGMALLGSSTNQPILELLQRGDGASNTGAIQMWRGNPREASPRIYITAGTSNSYINTGGYLGINTNSPSTNLDVAGNINASIYYDRDNTNYYLDPAANTMPYAANLNGDIVQDGNLLSSIGAWTTVSTTTNWYTVGYLSGGRGYGEFLVENTQSSQHQVIKFIASIQYGNGAQITVLQNSDFGNMPFTAIRIAQLSTNTVYGAYAVQVYGYDLYGTSNANRVRMMNQGNNGWVIYNFTTAENANYVATAAQVSLTQASMVESGSLAVGGSMYSIEHDNGTATGATTINWLNGNTQTLVLGASPIALTFNNGQPGAHYTLALKQDATGSRLVTWPGNVRWSSGVAPTLTTTANKTDYVEFVYDGLSSTFDGVGFNANF